MKTQPGLFLGNSIIIEENRLPILVKVSITVKRHKDHSNSYKRKCFIVAGLRFGGLIHYHYNRKHGGIQADLVLEK